MSNEQIKRIKEHLSAVNGSSDWADLAEILDWYKRDVSALLAAVADAHPEEPQDVRALIKRVVTGDGAQLENLDLTDDEWRALAEDMHGADGEEHFEVTMRLDDWLAMVRIAREPRAALPDAGGRVSLTPPSTKDQPK